MTLKIIKFILIIVCMVTIFLFSNDSGVNSTKKSDFVIIHTTKFFLGNKLTSETYQKYINLFVTPVRKGAHFIIYFILGVLLISFIKEYRSVDYICILIAISISFIYACTDEVHQLFIPGRSFQIMDIILDTIGSLIGAFIYFMCYTKSRYFKEKNYE